MSPSADELSAAPVLSTPAEHTFFEDPTPTSEIQKDRPHRTDDELFEVYEVARTAARIIDQKWRRVALQFPDAMLPDAPWVVDALTRALEELSSSSSTTKETEEDGSQNREKQVKNGKQKESGDVKEVREVDMTMRGLSGSSKNETTNTDRIPRLYILADTSYSACCVDEIAAEHADADGVVHFGRACLSPTSRLPVLHIFTRQKLDYEIVARSFETEFPEPSEKIIVMADVMFQEHVVPFCDLLKERGYTNVVATEIVRDPGGTIPNRKVVGPKSTEEESSGSISSISDDLKEYHLFHISTPPTSLLLTLSSRLSSLRIYPTPSSPYTTSSTEIPDPSTTPSLLRRRYALVIRLATASIIGILVNTLSVKNYMDTISVLKAQIAAAGKKSYTIVVGKLNAAKLANFSEVDGWVVVGCWESGLVEQDGLWKPVITPFEMRLALQGDETRVWTGEWWGGIEGAREIGREEGEMQERNGKEDRDDIHGAHKGDENEADGGISDEESEPPEFDLRTGKLVSHSRPMRAAAITARISGASRDPSQQQQKQDLPSSTTSSSSFSSSLVKRAKAGELATVNGVVSPGAEYLRSQRTWQGLGSDFDVVEDEASAVVEQGRSGVARGYVVGVGEEGDGDGGRS